MEGIVVAQGQAYMLYDQYGAGTKRGEIMSYCTVIHDSTAFPSHLRCLGLLNLHHRLPASHMWEQKRL